MGDSIRSYGGAAGEAAVTGDLIRASARINEAADALDSAGRFVYETEGYVDAAIGHGSSSTSAAARHVRRLLWAARYGGPGTGTGRTAVATRDVADRLRVVAATFLEAEQAAMAHVSRLTRARLAVGSMWGTGIWVARHTLAATLTVGSGPAPLIGLGRSIVTGIRPEGLPPTTGFLNEGSTQLAVSGMDSSVVGFELQVYALAAAVATLEGLFGEGHASTVKERGQSYPARSPSSLEEVMEGIQAEENRMDGSVSIETITQVDGTRCYVVTIPGTQDWGPANDNPYDAQANLPGVLGDSSDAQQAVVDAMRAAGIQSGEQVMLAGHSQGGINAAALASRPEFLAEFNVTHVVTAGSPVGRIALPPSVNTLHLEHTEDLVAGLDGTANPATATRTTVQQDLLLSDDPRMQRWGRDIAGAHHLYGYSASAALVDAGSAGKSATAWKASASSFFSGAKSTLTEYVPVVPPPVASVPIEVIPQPSAAPEPRPPVEEPWRPPGGIPVMSAPTVPGCPAD